MNRIVRWSRCLAWCMVVMAFLAPVRPGAAADALKLGDVLSSVDASHPGLEEVARKLDAAQGKTMAARGGFDPRFSIRSRWNPVGYYENGQLDAVIEQATPLWGTSVFAGYRLGWGSYPIYKGELQTLSSGEVRAGAAIPFWRDGRIDSRRAKIQQARVLLTAAEQAQLAKRIELQRDAAKAYWSWVASGKQVEVALELLALARDRAQALREQVEAGAIEPVVLMDNERQILDRRAKLISAERKFRAATLELSLYLRDANEQPSPPDPTQLPRAFPEVGPLPRSIEEHIQEAIRTRPDLLALEARRDASQVDVRLARNQRSPRIDGQTYVSKDFGQGPEYLAPVEWGAGLVMEVPIGLRTARGELKAAQSEVAAMRARLRALTDRVAVEIRVAHASLLLAAESVNVAQEQVSLAHALAEAERVRFSEGGSDLVILNLRELAAAEASNLEIEASADFQRAWVDFMAATGRTPLG